MAKKYLYGTLNQDTVRPNYGGSTTDSLVINVDNNNMIISGEVKWDAAIGELAHKAYPGDKGARNYAKILELTAILEEEVVRASKSRASVESKVGELEKSFNILDNSLTVALRAAVANAADSDSTILDKCIAEAERALRAEANILSQLSKEVKERTSVDAELIKRLDNLSGLSSDSLDQVRALIVDEGVRAQEAEDSLQNNLDAETLRALNVEQALQQSLSSLGQNIATNQQKVDIALAEETRARIVADDAITDLIEIESVRAQEVETDLLHDIGTLQESIVVLKTAVEFLEQNVISNSTDQLKAEIESVQDDIVNLEKELSQGIQQIATDVKRLEQLHLDDKKTLETELEEIDHSISLNTDLVSKLSEKLEDINKHLSTLDVAIHDAQTATAHEIAQRQTADSELEKSIQAVDKELDIVNKQLLSSTQSAADKIATIENSIQVIDGSIKEICSSVTDLHTTDVVTQEELTQLNKQLKTVYNNIDGLQTALDTEIERAKLAEQICTNAVEELKIVDSVHTTQISSITESIISLTTLVQDLSNEIASNNQRDVVNEATVAELSGAVETLKEQLINQSTIYAGVVEEIIDDLHSVNDKVELTFSGIDNMRLSIDIINNKLQELSSAYETIAREVARVDEAVVDTNERISGVQDQLHTTTSRIDNTLADHQAALTKHDVSTHQHDVDIANLQDAVKKLQIDDALLEQKIVDVNNERIIDSELHNAHYKELVSRIEQEIKRAVAADASLLADTNRNSGRITSLQLDLTNVISKYVQELKQADEQLDEKIDHEHTVAEEYKEKLLDKIEEVNSDSLQRDDALQAQIDILTTNKNSVPLIENEGNMPEVYAQQGDKTFTIKAERTVVPNAIVRRDSAGNILLSNNLDGFTTHSAVSKLFVDNIISELRKEISFMSFDFIDGGNAPIG